MFGEQTFAQLRTGLTVRILDSSARDPEFQSHALEAAWSVARITKRVMFDVCLHVSSPGNILLPRDDKSCWKIHSVHDLSLFRQYHYNLFFLFSSHACVCVCACVRACVRACVCVCVRARACVLSLSVTLSLSVCLSLCLCLSICLCLSVCQSVSVCLPACLPACPSLSLSLLASS